MMKNLATLTSIFLLAAVASFAQVKTTEETRTESQTTVDTTTGKVVTTSNVTSIEKKEDVTPRHHMISTDPIKFVMLYNIEYDYAVTPQITVGGGISVPTALSDYHMKGFGVNLNGRFYPGKKPFYGFHINPTFSITSIAYDHDTDAGLMERVHDTPVSLGLYMGWHWYPWEEFATDISIGGDYNITAVQEQGLLGLGSDLEGLVPGMKFTIGYSW